MKIITKYVMREHVGPFVFAATALTSLMLLQFVGKRLGELVGKGLPWRVLLEFFVLSMPLTVAMTLPMAVLVAVLYAYTRLASENEITAFRASGVSMRALMLPTLVAGAAVGLGMLVFNDQVLSYANHQLAVLQNDIQRTKPSFALKEQIINTVVDQKLYLRASHIDRGSQEMKDVVIWDVSNPAHRRTIYANHGALGVAANGTDVIMHLYDGHMAEVPTQQPTQFTRMYFKQDVITVRDVTNSFQASDADSATKSDREMSVCEMQRKFADVDFGWQQARYTRMQAQADLLAAHHEQNIQRPAAPQRRNPFGLGSIYCGLLHGVFGVKVAHAATLQAGATQGTGGQGTAGQGTAAQGTAGQGTAGQAAPRPLAPSQGVPNLSAAPQERQLTPLEIQAQMEGAIAREKVMKFQRIRYDIEIQKKFSLAAACIIFVLLGPPIALRFPRGGVGMVIGVSFGVFALYYVGLIGGETLANAEYISPFWAMWSANLAMFVTGVVLSLRMNRLAGATRGGDWSELRGVAGAALRWVTGRRREGQA